MENYDELMIRFKKIREAKSKLEMLENLPEELASDERIKKLHTWLEARYYYVDKKKIRMGDRFVWLYLAGSSHGGDKRALKQYKEVYDGALLSMETQKAREIDPNGLEEELIDAATIYVESISEPRPILGLIRQSDRDDEQKHKRISKIIIESHLYPMWRYSESYPYILEVGGAFVAAAERIHPTIIYTIRDTIDMMVEDNNFKVWLDMVLAKAEEYKEKRE